MGNHGLVCVRVPPFAALPPKLAESLWKQYLLWVTPPIAAVLDGRLASAAVQVTAFPSHCACVQRWQRHCMELHKQRLGDMKHRIDNTKPETYDLVLSKGKRHMLEKERQTEVDRVRKRDCCLLIISFEA